MSPPLQAPDYKYVTEECLREWKSQSAAAFRLPDPVPMARFLYELCWAMVRGDLPPQKCRVALDSVVFVEEAWHEESGSVLADIVAHLGQDITISGEYRNRLVKMTKSFVESSLIVPRLLQERCEVDDRDRDKGSTMKEDSDPNSASKRRKIKRESALEAGEYTPCAPQPPSHGAGSSQLFELRERERKGAISQHRASHADDLPRVHAKDSTSKTSRREADQELYNVTHVDGLVRDNRWDLLDEYLLQLLQKFYLEPVRTHPVLFLHVRRCSMLDMIDKGRLDEARTYYNQKIRTPFNEVVALGQSELPFASLLHILDDIAYCERCATAGIREHHLYSDSEVIKKVIHDYLRLYAAELTEFEIPTDYKKKWWRFAVKITKQRPESKKGSFRCIVCSMDVHNKGSGFIPLHLKDCSKMDTSQAEQMYNATLKMVAPVNNYVQVGKATAMKGFRDNLDLARRIQASLARIYPTSNEVFMLSTILDNVRIFAELVFSSTDPATSNIQQSLPSVSRDPSSWSTSSCRSWSSHDYTTRSHDGFNT